MYKSRLQELCQQRRWRAPEYTTSRDGADHNPRFRASVAVGGSTFVSPATATSAKEAQNSAAQAAFENLVTAAPPPPAPAPAPAPTTASRPPENHIPFKTQLQSYVQRKSLDLPLYDHVREGPSHNPQFKATVRVDGQTFESLHFFSTLKEAEHDAAKVALSSLPLEEIKEPKDEPGFYKNLLQEMAQKKGFSLPIYTTVNGGMCHMPTFSSTVEIEGENFQGDVAKTKKQAEMNAAKVAWYQLKERSQSRSSGGCALSCEVPKVRLPASSSFTAKAVNFQQPRVLSHTKRWIEIEEGVNGLLDKEQGDVSSKKIEDKNNSVAIFSSKILLSDQTTGSPKEIFDKNKQSVLSFEESDSDFATEKVVEKNALYEDMTSLSPALVHSPNLSVSTVETDLPQGGQRPLATDSKEVLMMNTISGNGISSSSAPSDSSDCEIVGTSNISIETMACSLLCNRVQVYPRKPDLVLPRGATILPFSDDMWVAVSLDFSHHEGSVSV